MPKISISKQQLINGLSVVSKAIQVNPVIPLYSSLLFVSTKENATLYATDFELSVSVKLFSNGDEFTTAIPAKLFSDVINIYPDDEVNMEFDKISQSMKIASDTSKNNIKCLNSDDFVTMKKFSKHSVTVNSTVFKSAISRVSFCAIKDSEASGILKGIQLSRKDNKLVLFAADGFHMSKEEVPVKFSNDNDFNVIVKSSTLDTICKMLQEDEDLFISASDSQLEIKNGNINISCQVLSGKFPDYKQLIVDKSDTIVSLSVSSLKQGCKQLELFTDNKISFSINGALVKMNTESDQRGESEYQTFANVEGNPIELNLNVFLLRQLLDVCFTEEVILELNTSRSPVVAKMKDYPAFYHIIMPIN